jgi:hypothetical protein
MLRAVLLDMLDGFVQPIDQLHAKDQRQPLGVEIFRPGRHDLCLRLTARLEDATGFFCRPQFDPAPRQAARYIG